MELSQQEIDELTDEEYAWFLAYGDPKLKQLSEEELRYLHQVLQIIRSLTPNVKKPLRF